LAPRDELTSSPHEQNQEIHRLPLESDPMSVAAQLVRRDIKHEVAKAKRPVVFRERHLLVALRCHNSSDCRQLERQIIDRLSPAPLHGQVRRDQAGLRRFQCNPCGGKPVIKEGRYEVDRFGSTLPGS
jgi:hypothetical protein